MMKVYIDTNILMDFLLPEREHYYSAACLFDLARGHKIELFLSTQSILDAYYSATKLSKDRERIRHALDEITRFVNIVSIHQFGVAKALKAGVSDVEDLAQAATADAESCQLVITNNKDFPYYPDNYPIPQMSSKTFVEMCRSVEAS